jgi:3-deoxy-D-manno-octulosonic-acid transferase
MSVAWTAYRIAAPCLGAIAPAASMFASSKERALWHERMGNVRLPGGCDAWVHGASLGEATAVIPLVRELARFEPGARFCLTATTRAGRARLAASGMPAHLAPIDAPQAVRRFFGGVRPKRAWIVETELWPHWLLRARAERVPVGILSARLSERSLHSYLGLGRELRSLISGLATVLCQSDEDARRWLALGAPESRTAVVGNLKIDALPAPAPSRAAARHALGLDPARPLLVLGSVRPGELGVVARAWRRVPDGVRERWQVAVVPRHARAGAELREEAARARQPLAAGDGAAPGAWRWDDRSGVLNDYYAAAEVAFVGGSLRPFGGHNPLEPAACGAAVVIGAHHQSQLAVVRALQATDGVSVVAGEAELAEALERLLGDAALRERQVAAGTRALEGLRGAARRAVAHLSSWDLWPA